MIPFVAPYLIAAVAVGLAWTESPDPRMNTDPPSGYVIVYGKASAAFADSVDVGRTNHTTVAGLLPNTVYYFAAYAYTKTLQSELTPEVSARTRLERPKPPTRVAIGN